MKNQLNNMSFSIKAILCLKMRTAKQQALFFSKPLLVFCTILSFSIGLQAQNLVHNFEFNGNLNDTKATGISLFSFNNANSTFNTNPNGWNWTENTSGGGGGLVLNTNLLTNPQVYSFGFRISFHETGPGYKKIISFKGPADDNGLYFYNSKLKFFPFRENPKIYANNTFYDFILTRDASKNIKVYIVEANGSVTEVYNEPDPTDAAVPRQSNGSYEFRLFMDDTQTNGEHTTGGSVRGIRLWDYPLSSSQIATALSSVTTNDASNITSSFARLNGEINPQGNTSNFSFEYGTTTAYGKTVTGNPANSSSSAAINVTANIASLLPATTYHYRVKSVVGTNTIYGADKTFTTSTVGEHALHFDGTDDHVRFNSMPPYPNNAVTFEAWLRTTSSDLAKEIIGYSNTSSTDCVEFRISNGRLQFGLNQNNAFVAVTGTTLVNTGEWVHVAAVKSGSSIKLYVNGKEDATGTLSQTPTVNTLNIGTLFQNGAISPTLNYFFNGLIDEVRIWNVAKTQAQIEAGITSKLSGSETGLTVSYSMNQGIPSGNNTSDSTLTELKGAYNGILRNFTLNGSSSNFVDRGKLSLNPILGNLLWLRADTGVTSTSNNLNNWVDLSGNNAFNKSGNIGFKTNALNFNPVVTINNSDALSSLPTNRLDGNTPISYVDGFAVYKQTDNNSNFLGGVQAASQFGVALFASFGNNTSYVGNGNFFTYQSFNAAALTNNFGITNLDISSSTTPFSTGRFNGKPQTMSTGTGNNFDTIRFVPMIGGTNNNGLNPSSGWPHAKVELAEIMLYPSSLSALNKSKVETYLSLKYGITLDSSTVPNYVNSTGTAIWNNKTYWHDVFGIGKDNGNSLNQSSSNSINSGSGDGNGQIGKANIVLSNPTSMDDGDYLIIGHDKGSLAEQTTDLPTSLPNNIRYKRLGREWKVQHTGNIGNLVLKLDINGLCLAGLDSSHYQLLVDTDGDGNFTTGTVTVIPAASLSSKIIRFQNINLPNNIVFTLAISQPTLTLQSAIGINAQTICERETIDNISYTLKNATRLSVTGLPAGVTSNFVNNQLTIAGTPTVTGTFKYLITPDSQCGTNPTDSGTIIINALPAKPTITPASSTSFCTPGSVVLRTNATTGIEWQIGGNAITNAASSSYSATNSGTYTVTSTINGCSSDISDPIQVTANQTPTTPIISTRAGTVFCQGSGAILQTSSSVGTQWYRNGVLLNAANKISYVADTSGVYTVAVLDSNSCVSGTSNPITITINPLPIVAAIGNGNATFCAESDLQMTNATSGGVWNTGNATLATVGSNGLVHGISAGITTITYSVTNPNTGCSKTVSTAIKVEPLPAKPTITPSGSTSFCTPDSVILTSSASTGNLWLKNGILISGATNQSFAASTTGTYTLINRQTFCNSPISDPIDVTANATLSIPTLKVSGSKNLCEGESVKLFTSNAIANEWYRDGILIPQETGSSLTANLSGNYAVKSVNTNGCVSGTSMPVLVTVNPLPTISTITGDAIICEGASAQLGNSYTGGVWTTSNAGIININAQGQMQAISSGTAIIKYIATNSFGCTSIASKLISVTALPTKPSITPSGATAFCTPGSVVLNSSSTLGNQWYLNGSIISGATSNSYTATASGSYTIVNTQNNCASLMSDQIEVFANTTPTAPVLKASKSTTICDGESVKLNTSNSIGIEWFRNGVLLNGVSGSTYTATEGGSYTIKANSIKGCESGTSLPIVVTVNPLPTVAPITGVDILCATSSSQLGSTTSGGVWNSSNTGIASINATGLLQGLSAGTASISYTITNPSGCAITTSKFITVTALPTKPSISAGGVTSFCAPGSVVLNSSAGIGNQWFKNGVAIAGETNSSYIANSSGTYTLVSTQNNCASILSNAIVVSANLTPSLSPISGPDTLCATNSAQLVNTISGGIWASNNPNVIVVDGNGLIQGLSAGTATISYTVTNTSGCSTTVLKTVSITALPPKQIISAAGPTSFCLPGSVELNSSETFGNQWFKNGVAIIGETSNIYNANASGTYTIINTQNNCASIQSDPIEVIGNSTPIAPVLKASKSTIICDGESVRLNTSNTATTEWFKDGVLMNGVTGSTYIATVSGSYTIKANSAKGCESGTSLPVIVVVNPMPTVAPITGADIVCATSSTQLSSASNGGVWTSTNNGIASINGNGLVQALSAGTVTINYTITNPSGCAVTTSKSITVTALPAKPTITAAGPTAFCTPGSVVLNSSATTGNQWFKNGVAIAGETNATYTANSSGTYTLVNTQNNCASIVSDQVEVTANKTPTTPILKSAKSNEICEGESVKLYTSNNIGNEWFKNGIRIPGITGNTFTATESGTYTLKTENVNGCLSGNSNAIIITVNPMPIVAPISGNSKICVNASEQLSNSSTGGIWSSSNTSILSIDGNGVITALYSGIATINYQVFNSNGSCGTTVSKQINISPNPVKPVIQAGSQTSFCAPGSVVLTSSFSTGNQWYKDGIGISGAVTNSFTAISSGNYSIINTQDGCTSQMSDLVSVSANITAAVPILKAATNTSICTGQEVKLSTSSITGNEWYKDGILIAGVTGNSYTANTTGSYTVKSNNTSGCVSGTSNAINVIVNTLPTVPAISGITEICEASNAQLTNSIAGGAWQTSNSTVLTVDPTGLIQSLNAGSAMVSYSVNNSNGTCSTTVTKLITVKKAPSKPTISALSATQFCLPGSVDLISNNVSGNQWFKNGNSILGETGSSYTATSSGTYTLVNSLNGCTSNTSDPIEVAANAKAESPILKAGKSTTVCDGDFVKLTTSSQNNNIWYRDGIKIDGASGSFYDASISGNYTVSSESLTGCISGLSNSVSVTVFVKPYVQPIIGITQICEGLISNYKNKFADGKWTSSNPTVATIDKKGSLTALKAGNTNISFTVTNTAGCSTTTTTNVTVFAAPKPQPIIGLQSICKGLTTALTNANPNGLWASSNTSLATINDAGIVNGINNGNLNISYTVTNSNGCVAVSNTGIIVNPLPLVSASSNLAKVSKGLQVNLSATGIGSFLWTPSSDISSPTSANTSARVTANTTYTVRLTDANGCINTASVPVEIVEDLYVNPVIVMTPNGDGLNDKFVIKNLDQYPNNKLQVFDRTGKLLYETQNYANNWDGTVKGQLLTKDTYLYILSINGQIVKKGTISLIR
jgi:gliding motility-associated-like protein